MGRRFNMIGRIIVTTKGFEWLGLTEIEINEAIKLAIETNIEIYKKTAELIAEGYTEKEIDNNYFKLVDKVFDATAINCFAFLKGKLDKKMFDVKNGVKG